MELIAQGKATFRQSSWGEKASPSVTDLTINLQINAQVPKVCHLAWHVSCLKTTYRLISHLGGCREPMDMPVRGHEGQMGQCPHLRAHTGIPKTEESGIMSRARGGVEREAGLLYE